VSKTDYTKFKLNACSWRGIKKFRQKIVKCVKNAIIFKKNVKIDQCKSFFWKTSISGQMPNFLENIRLFLWEKLCFQVPTDLNYPLPLYVYQRRKRTLQWLVGVGIFLQNECLLKNTLVKSYVKIQAPSFNSHTHRPSIKSCINCPEHPWSPSRMILQTSTWRFLINLAKCEYSLL